MTTVPVRPDDDLYPGRVLGPYELVLPVGIGGMAHVWAARVRATSQVVALKMLLPELAQNPAFEEMFLDEARIASRVRHPNVCATFDFASYDGVTTLAMEWVDGGSLMRIVRPGPETDEYRPRVPIPFRHVARIVADACAGLHAAHELVGDDGRSLGVVHRDVSPHNLLITSQGIVKVTDFGVAKALGKSSVTIAGQIKGKLGYMAPEQLTGDGVDRRSDVFSLGCVLYEATTGTKPFRGEHDPQIMASIMIGRYDPPSAVIAGFPAELEAIIVRALDVDPAQRFPTAEHLRGALEQYLAASGPPIGSRDVAALLHERCGADIAARDQALRAAAGPRGAAESGGSGAMEIDRRPPAAKGGFLWFAFAVMLGAGLGLGVLSYLRANRKPKAPTTTSTATVASAPSATAEPSAAPSATADRRPRPVRLHVEPSHAVVVIDGVALPEGDTVVMRPADGGAIDVIVRADNYDDTIVVVDPATPDEVDVSLVPATAHVRTAAPKKDAGKTADPAADAAAASTPEMPPNPYE